MCQSKMSRILISFAFFLNTLSTTFIAVLLILPDRLYPVWSTSNQAQTYIYTPFKHILCRIPRYNLPVTKADVIIALDLPNHTFISDELYQMGKCKAAATKIGLDGEACFCVDSFYLNWALCISAINIAIFAFANVTKFVSAILTRTTYASELKRASARAAIHLSFGLVLFTALAVGCHMMYLSTNLRIVLPGYPYDEAFFIPSFSYTSVVFMAVLHLLLVIPDHLAIITYSKILRTLRLKKAPAPRVAAKEKNCKDVSKKCQGSKETNWQTVPCEVGKDENAKCNEYPSLASNSSKITPRWLQPPVPQQFVEWHDGEVALEVDEIATTVLTEQQRRQHLLR